eukprot:10225412-Alexandrium_andersonii.AAC.1
MTVAPDAWQKQFCVRSPPGQGHEARTKGILRVQSEASLGWLTRIARLGAHLPTRTDFCR